MMKTNEKFFQKSGSKNKINKNLRIIKITPPSVAKSASREFANVIAFNAQTQTDITKHQSFLALASGQVHVFTGALDVMINEFIDQYKSIADAVQFTNDQKCEILFSKSILSQSNTQRMAHNGS